MGTLDAIQSLGVKIKSEAEVRKELNGADEQKQQPSAPIITIKPGIKEIAIKKKLIPETLIDYEFSEEKVRENVERHYRVLTAKYKIFGFQRYIRTINYIISCIRSGVRPERSYLIGAPNHFGKTSFVITCIKLMLERDWRVVPYVPLLELAEIKTEYEKEMLRGTSYKKFLESVFGEDYIANKDRDKEENYEKLPEVVVSPYSWSEYMNCDVLFTFFTQPSSKAVESYMLKTILDIRGSKGLPTIVLMSTSLDPYLADKDLREQVFEEILMSSEEKHCYDKVYYVSCYKMYKKIIDENDKGLGLDDDN